VLDAPASEPGGPGGAGRPAGEGGQDGGPPPAG
jgi:hypothetical protein